VEKAKAIAELSPTKYGKLLSAALPKVIETRAEFDRAVALMEALDRREVQGETLSREESALRDLLGHLVKIYDDRIELPLAPPHRMIRYLMEQRDLKQADLLPIFGARSVASDVINGKREPSKAHIRALAAFFHISPAAFL
jgi:HTH-type transcriptional regulator / antitoxin HigA